jgi:KaiC/GvpD/RAD55 family RecA-like ATPase
MALFKFKSQCPKCVEKGGDKSKDNLANYSDGGKHCFSCGYHVHGDENYVPNEEEEEMLDDIKEMSSESKERIKQGTTHKITWRGIKPETNKFFGVVYECSQETGAPIKQFVPTTIDGGHVGYKTRVMPKDFSHPVGEVGQKCDLIGSFRFVNGGKYVVLCAGEVDFLSAFQMLRDYQLSKDKTAAYDPIACVTPTVGEGGCGKQLQHNYKFLDKFERVIVCFDSDAAGKAAVEKITPLLPRGKVYIMTPRYKDCNEYLTKGKEREFVTDFYNAKKHTPAGIVASTEIYKEVVQRSLLERLPFPPFLEKLNKMLSGGITYGFIVNILAGSGSGKSSLINQCVIHWAKECNILTGVVSLEADSAAYGENLLSCYAGKKLALISNKEEKHSVVTSEYMENCAKELFSYEDGSPRMYILDDRGDYSELQSHVEELITSFGVKVIVFDVISDVFAGMSIEDVDKYMKWEKNIVKQYNCILINISHTRKSGGGQKAASQGAFLTEEATIGSGTQYRSAGINISLQRDKTAEDDVERNTTQVYLLKSRDTGVTGLACEIFYENETHTLYDKEYYFSQIKPPSF